jgi:hypothetical protein
MKKKKDTSERFVICVDNSDYPASLELHKGYTALPDERAAEDDCLRVIDESGEDYLYSEKRFVSIDLPLRVRQSVNRRVHETTKLANKGLQPTASRATVSPDSGVRRARGG